MPDIALETTPTDEQHQLAVLHDGLADMSFVRLPVDRQGINLIPLYRELPVAVVNTDHAVAAYDEVSVADLADEHLLQDPADVPEWRDLAVEVRDGTRLDVPSMTIKEAIEVVASGTGIVIVPKSVARLYARKDVTHRPVTGLAETQIGLAWLSAAADPRIETFIGIVRGRTERSSRASVDPAPVRKAASIAPNAGQKKERQRSAGKRATRGGRGRRRGQR